MSVAAKHAEIARRYAWQGRQHKTYRAPLTVAGIRPAELERVYRHRFDGRFPSTREGLDALTLMASHLLHKNTPSAIAGWLGKVAPWIREFDSAGDDIVRKAQGMPKRWTASDLGERINLTLEERKLLRIKTIRAVGQTAATMAEDRRRGDRERQERRRRDAGARPRAEYEATSKSQTKPWEAMGMSRSTWYDKGQPQPPAVRTGPSAVKVSKILIADAPVRARDLYWPSALCMLSHSPSQMIFDEGLDRSTLVFREAS